ncbi:MAG: hypothetical protein WDN46_20495 [Methylocella sp.]
MAKKSPMSGDRFTRNGWSGREAAVRDWIAAPGPALLDVFTDRMQLVMPPKIGLDQAFGTALYSAKAVLAGRIDDVWELVTDNLT